MGIPCASGVSRRAAGGDVAPLRSAAPTGAPGHRGGGVYDEGPIHAATDDAILKTYLTRLVLGDMITEVAVEGGVAGGVGGLAPPPPPAYTQVPRLADPHSATTMEEVAAARRRRGGGGGAGFTERDFEEQFRERPRSLQKGERELMTQFDEVYMTFIQNVATVSPLWVGKGRGGWLGGDREG